MAKHPTGKYLRVPITSNDKNLLIYVVRGSKIDDMPPDEDEDYPGDMQMLMPQLSKDFDAELNEALDECESGDVIVFMCTTDMIFEHAYSKIKAMLRA
ncbi:hypothetical protein [Buttiauxella massiliensis]|uniref:hypothetical protein n=1 Tax=Buttiauxella massiliensis TaxID=2831590 RepID=UPI00125FAC60|nr:hypothetical protein [Buttiauxella massiliensis]